MITLITGTPGTGKTAWVLNELLELKKNDPERTLFIHGIRSLDRKVIPHITVYCKSQLCDICQSQKISSNALFVELWHEWAEPGSLLVIDEVQRIWRPRNGTSSLPPSVSGLETHRHQGLDFWLISQGPHLFDNFIRLLIGRHIHLVSKWSGRSQYEWPECKQDVQSRSDAIIRPYSLPKRVYKLYKSAEVHTKQDKRKPLSFYFIIILLAVFLSFGTYLYSRISGLVTKQVQPVAVSGQGAALAAPSTDPATTGSSSYPDFNPSVEGVPESAPAYSELVKVTSAPILAGCVFNKSTSVCKCFTSQATPYPASQLFCKEVVAGHRFNPFLRERPATQPQQPLKSADAGQTENAPEPPFVPSYPDYTFPDSL
jgi:zona occludens toxin